MYKMLPFSASFSLESELVIARTGETLADLSEADTPGGRDHVPDLDIAGAGELAQRQLHEVERTTNHDENHQVGDEEGPATILVSRVGEPPDITKANLGEGEGEMTAN